MDSQPPPVYRTESSAGISQVFVDFGSFLQSSNILGLATGFLIAQSTLEVSRTAVSAISGPIVASMRGLRIPEFDWQSLGEAAVTFLLTMFLAFIVIRFGKINTTPIPIVQVANI